MPFDIGAIAGGIAEQAAGGLFGLALQGHNDRRQLKQQEKLQNLQIKGQKELSDYGYNQSMKYWENTNYGPQMEQLRKAGLNPGLIYGMGGAGGATGGPSSAGNVGGGQAPTGGNEIMAGMGIAMQKAQMDLIKAQTEKTEVEAAKTAGVDTQEAGGRISLMNAEFSQKLAQTDAIRLENAIKEIEVAWTKDTKAEGRNPILYAALRAMNEADIAGNHAEIQDDTIKDQKDKIKAEAIGASIANAVMRQGIAESKSKVALNAEQIQGIKSQIKTNSELTLKWLRENEQGWQQLDTKNKEIAVRQLLEATGQMNAIDEAGIKAVGEVLEGLMKRR